MPHKKHYAAALIALSVLALAGCGHSSDSSGGAPGPNAADQAAAARMQSQGGPNAGQQAAGQAAAARAASQKVTPQNTPK